MVQPKMKKGQKLAILVGGGPAPGINGVISAATIEAINQGIEVIGIRDGFRWISQGNINHIDKLTIAMTSRIHNTGGSRIGISRVSPLSTPNGLKNTIKCLKKLQVKYLITIGGDGTLYLATRLEKELKGSIKIVHVPKTIDNNMPIPGYIPTFGFETARHIGTELVHHLMEDAKTTRRWYFVVTMGRKTGHLALGIGKASGATLTIIPEEFKQKKISLENITKILEGSIIKRKLMGREDGVAILAEGITDKLDEHELNNLNDVSRDEHGRIRLSEVDLGQVLKHQTLNALKEKGVITRIVDTTIGYELRSAPPIPFDASYTRTLGYSAVKFLLKGGSGALITIQKNKKVPIPFEKVVNPKTDRVNVRYVDVNTEAFEVGQKYMIKLKQEDLDDRQELKNLSALTNLKPSEFKAYFSAI